ncbi:MAG: MATE family efflux transporter, partial [Rhodospirillaceae bacterium]|nr:MATE family efflux transporter [Rhodospirillaceae bacterium]
MPAMVIGACKAFLVQVPLAYAGAYFGGIQGIFISMGLSTVLVSGLAYVWLRRTVNEQEALIAQAPVPQAS